MIEQWGYGVRRMFNRAAALGLPEPSYVELPGRLRFIVPTRHAQIMVDALLTNGQSHQVVTLLTAAVRGPISRADLLRSIGISNDTRNARRHINPLLTSGWLELVDPDNPHNRNQQYRLTDPGRAYLAQHKSDF